VTESWALRPSVARLFALARACLGLVCAIALTAGPAGAASSTQPLAAPKALPVPGAFQLPASNGYTLDVIAERARAGRPASLFLFVTKRGKGVRYQAPATVTETSMQADLGELGEISVNFRRTNQATSAPCGKETVRFDSGQYEGKIDFRGEEGYASVEATSAPGSMDFILSGLLCDMGFVTDGSSGRARGAELHVRNPALGPELSVSKKRPGAAASIVASMTEYRDGISIERITSLFMPSANFKYDRRLRTATVRPPAPFAGSARFDLGKKAGQRWSGDLTVDLPGRTGVPLTGPTLRAFLAPDG
jgi:hypothetical protein